MYIVCAKDQSGETSYLEYEQESGFFTLTEDYVEAYSFETVGEALFEMDLWNHGSLVAGLHFIFYVPGADILARVRMAEQC